jgi:Ca2+-binding RTX toxin-like protein
MTKTLSTSTFNPTLDGYDFSTGTHVTVLQGVAIGSGQDIGIYADLPFDVLLNEGRIYSQGSAGVVLYSPGGATTGTITNAPGAVISGTIGAAMQSDGVGGGLAFYNYGKVVGTAAEGVYVNSVGSALISNHGSVTGHEDGIFLRMFDATGKGEVDNYHLVKGSIGIQFSHDSSPGTTEINNFAGGTIEGTKAAIDEMSGSLGHFRLINHGVINGNVDNDNNGKDVIVNSGTINGLIELGSGNCHFNGTGGRSGAIIADGGNDHIIAGKGNLLIELGGGSSTLTGGPGHDRFFFDAPLAGQVDKITNFKHGLDKIILSATDFAGVGPVGTLATADFHIGTHAATGSSQYIIYNPANGFVFYDPHDGSPQDHFATLSPHLGLTHSDFLVAA